MAENVGPFKLQRTIGKLTFYMMEGRNFVRKKSSLTRRKVLYSPQFENTRHNAGVLAKASKIGSLVYNTLPEYWRQGWMYRSFTGEAYTMLKKGKKEEEIQQVLLQRYVELVINKQPEKDIVVPSFEPPKRSYRKLNSEYWRKKTQKSIRRKELKTQVRYHAGILGRASKIGSKLYAHIPRKHKDRAVYQQLTAWAMQLLKDEWDEADIIAGLLPTLPISRSHKCTGCTGGVIIHPKGKYYFITSPHIRSYTYCSLIDFPNFVTLSSPILHPIDVVSDLP
jgi:hypothetical protein